MPSINSAAASVCLFCRAAPCGADCTLASDERAILATAEALRSCRARGRVYTQREFPASKEFQQCRENQRLSPEGSPAMISYHLKRMARMLGLPSMTERIAYSKRWQLTDAAARRLDDLVDQLKKDVECQAEKYRFGRLKSCTSTSVTAERSIA